LSGDRRHTHILLRIHNWFGQRGQLMDTNTRACAQAWTKGMHLG
jgi:hypothetical protein